MIYDELMSINIYDSISFVQCVEPNSLFDNDCDCSLDFLLLVLDGLIVTTHQYTMMEVEHILLLL